MCKPLFKYMKIQLDFTANTKRLLYDMNDIPFLVRMDIGLCVIKLYDNAMKRCRFDIARTRCQSNSPLRARMSESAAKDTGVPLLQLTTMP